jgi:hypothetical protein
MKMKKKKRRIKLPLIDWYLVSGPMLRGIEQSKAINNKIDSNLLAINESLRERLRCYE